MKTPTPEEITDKLHQAHFPHRVGVQGIEDPRCDTPMVVTLEQLRPYEHNPRIIRNPLYAELKASIRDRGLDQSPPITRRPGEAHFIIRNGGNTRLAILTELWQETHEERFFRIHCLFRPWIDESLVLLGHLTESDLHGPLTFIERALAIATLKQMIEQQVPALSQRELAQRLSQGGYPISQAQISRMLDTLEHVLPALPQVLYAGLGKVAIERLIGLRRRAEQTWHRYSSDTAAFEQLWMAVLMPFDADPTTFDVSVVQDDLLLHMAQALNQSPRLLALELFQQTPVRPISPSKAEPSGSDNDPAASPRPPQLPADPGDIDHAPPEPASQAARAIIDGEVTRGAIAPDPVRQPPSSLPTSLSRTESVIPPQEKSAVTDVLNQHWPIQPRNDNLRDLRNACALLATALARYAGMAHLVIAQEADLGFTLVQEHAPTTPRAIGIQLLLSALLRTQDDVSWPERQQLPSALFGQLMTGVYDQPLGNRAPLYVPLERLPDEQLLQLFELIRLSRRLVELSLSTTS